MKTLLLTAGFLANAAAMRFTNVHSLGNLLRFIPHNLFSIGSDGNIPGSSLKNGTFQQYIDHDNPALGTFAQHYWYNDQYCAGPGCPVVLFAPQEADLSLYYPLIDDAFLPAGMAKPIGAAVIAIEHRFWGQSSPYKVLSTENLQLLNLNQTIADLVHFAQTANLPFAPHGESTADKTPWVLMGVSYSGALTGWLEVLAPGTFAAYHASSAVVQAIGNLWEYFAPIQQNMPQNCSADVARVIEHVDSVGMTGTLRQQAKLKSMFGFGALPHYDDFAAALVTPLYLWQSSDFNGNYFYPFCDAIEGITQDNQTLPGATGIGLEKALVNYAAYIKNNVIPGYCKSYGYFEGDLNVDCFDTYNSSSQIYTDMSLSNTVDRQWTWMLCNEPFGYWQTGAPNKDVTLVSRYVTTQYFQRQCKYYFPTENGYTFGSAVGQTEDALNAYTRGWDNTNSSKLNWVNGGWDPWKDCTLSSDVRPGGPVGSTIEEPINIIPGGFHGSDWSLVNAKINAGAKQVIDFSINQIHTWVKEWKPTK